MTRLDIPSASRTHTAVLLVSHDPIDTVTIGHAFETADSCPDLSRHAVPVARYTFEPMRRRWRVARVSGGAVR